MISLSELVPWTAARELPSPNFNARKHEAIEAIVLHHTGGTDAGAENWMRVSRGDQAVSCHLHFRRDGSTTRMVDDAQRAWHAGAGTLHGRGDVNGRTLGWEIGNFGNGIEPYTDAQYAELARAATHYIRQGLTIADFVSHDYTADGIIGGGRKVDPYGFDWERFRRETLARVNGQPLRPAGQPWRVHSDYFGEDLIVTRIVSDREWYFVRERDLAGLREQRAQTPLSEMPPAKG